MYSKKLTKRIMSLILILITLFNLTTAYSTKATNYSSSLGTEKALGSPLVNASFTKEDWNKWEMLTFGVFLSNFTAPFVDSYKTAFSSGGGGTDGSGRRALVFASGGDVNSESILSTMLNYCINLQRDISQIRELKVDYSFYDFDKLDVTRSDEFKPRTANLRDLMVLVLKNKQGVNGKNFKDGDLPYVLTNKKLSNNGQSVSDYLTIKSDTGMNNKYGFEIISEAALTRVFLDVNGKEITLFDMTDGYDIQILSTLMSAILGADRKNKDVTNILEQAEKQTLYLDAFGNICIVHGGEIKIIIPSATNQHITKDNRYNFLNSMFLNGNYISEDDHTIATGLEATNEAYGVGQDTFSEIRGGNSGSDGKSQGIQAGQILIFEDTDIGLSQEIYKIKNLSPNATVKWDDLNLGKHMADLTSPSKTRGKINKPLKVEVVGGVTEGTWDFFDGGFSGGLLDIKGKNMISRMAQASALLSNAFPMETSHDVLNWMHSFTTEPMDLFDGHLYVSNSIPKSKKMKGGSNSNEGVKAYLNFYFNYITGSDTLTLKGLNIPDPKEQLDKVRESKIPQKMAGLAFNGNSAYLSANSSGSGLLAYYLWKDPHYGPEKGKELDNFANAKLKKYPTYIKGVSRWGEAQFNYGTNLVDSMRRIIKVYKKNPSLTIASDYLSLREGTEFSTYSTLIYLTYLDFYGILDNNESHKFNEDLFRDSGFSKLTPETALGNNLLSEEDYKKQVLLNTYLMLSPEGGRSYRNKLITNWFEDWMHQEYQKICYGKSTKSVVSSNISTRMSKGFLKIDSYEDNFLTSWFLSNYEDIVVVLMGILIIVVIIVGVIKGEKLSWFMKALGTVVLVLSLAPSTGEITPYICNRMIQRMFSENMTYWAVSESIENNTIEAENSSGSVQDKEVLSLVNSLNMLYLDKSIMIKKDISKKVVEQVSVDYGDIQRLKSIRWMLPTLIQQLSADDRSEDYVYTTLTDLYSDMRSGYWLYATEDIAETPVTQFVKPTVKYNQLTSTDKVGKLWEGYRDTSYDIDKSSDSTADVSIDGDEGKVRSENTGKSVARIRDDSDENVHTLSYMVDVTKIGNVNSKFKIVDPLSATGNTRYSKETWDKFGEDVSKGKFNAAINNSTYRDSFKVLAQRLIEDASTYNSYTTEPKQSFGYLWMTETPVHYFYQLVKDTFQENSKTVGLPMVILQLQGTYKENSEGIETRRSFMHKGDTGYVRDFLDMEELFTNVIPYMYTMQILAGGEDGSNGILGEELMDNYSIYEKNMQSWLFRSNWVTKIVEYPTYSDKSAVYSRDESGNTTKYILDSPLYPHNYPEDRPMVFSEAQMKDQGLNEADLSVVELKLIKIGLEVEKNWTLLINYSNAKGINKEVLYRQMAISALLSFNKHMSPDNWISASRALYPTTLDLRNISFDAVMKMIILSDTANSAYMSNDTMFAVIADGDTISGLLLLGTTWIASYAIPFLRDVVIGLMFYLGLISMIMGIYRDVKKATKSAGGFLISSIVLMVVTIMYYAVYALMITTSTVDSVLTIKNISMTTSVPVWKFLILFISSLIYLLVILRYMDFLWKNYRDMGFEIYHGIAVGAADKLGESFERVGDKLSGDIVDNAGRNAQGSGDATVKNTGDDPLKVQLVDSEVSIINNKRTNDIEGSGLSGDSGYNDERGRGNTSTDLSSTDIDKAIQEGKGIGKK